MVPFATSCVVAEEAIARAIDVGRTNGSASAATVESGSLAHIDIDSVWSCVVLMVLVPTINLIIKAGWLSSLDEAGVMQHHGRQRDWPKPLARHVCSSQASFAGQRL